MFILTKLVSRFLFPVALVIELFAAGLILIRVRKRRTGFCICSAALILLISASMHPVADLFLLTLEEQYQPLIHTTPDFQKKVNFIVVLGSGHSERKGLSDTTRLSPSATGRVTEAVRLSREFPGVKLIFTGGIVYGKIAISEAASRAAIGYGLSLSRVLIERLAQNTEEEAQGVSRLVGDGTVILVTSASHMLRAQRLFHAAGIKVIPAPADYQSMGGPYSPWSFIPSAGALQITERAWYEYMGLIWNAIRGKG